MAALWVMALCISAMVFLASTKAQEAVATPHARSFYLISLAQTPLPEAADAVLVKSLRSSVRIDDGVEADITLSIAEPMTAEGLEIAFAAELAKHGIALIRDGEGYRLADVSVAMVETPPPVIVGAPLPGPKTTIVRQPAPVVGPAPPDPDKGPSPWVYAISTVTALIVAVLGVRLAGPTIGRWHSRRDPGMLRSSARTNATQRDAVVDWLLSRHAVSLPLLASACDRAARLGRPVEQALLDVGAVTEAALADAYCAITGLSRWDPRTTPALSSGEAALDSLVERHPLRIVEMDAWSLVVASADPLDDRVYADLSRRARRLVTLRVAGRSEVPRVEDAVSDTAHDQPLVIVPWSRPRPDGARLLQAILARRTDETRPAGVGDGP